jgi:hypothetical protein
MYYDVRLWRGEGPGDSVVAWQTVVQPKPPHSEITEIDDWALADMVIEADSLGEAVAAALPILYPLMEAEWATLQAGVNDAEA